MGTKIHKMIVNYYYNNSTLMERVELTNVEAFVRGVRRYLTEVTLEGNDSSARIEFDDCPDIFAITLERGKWYYSKDGMDIQYKEFKARLSKEES